MHTSPQSWGSDPSCLITLLRQPWWLISHKLFYVTNQSGDLSQHLFLWWVIASGTDHEPRSIYSYITLRIQRVELILHCTCVIATWHDGIEGRRLAGINTVPWCLSRSHLQTPWTGKYYLVGASMMLLKPSPTHHNAARHKPLHICLGPDKNSRSSSMRMLPLLPMPIFMVQHVSFYFMLNTSMDADGYW